MEDEVQITLEREEKRLLEKLARVRAAMSAYRGEAASASPVASSTHELAMPSARARKSAKTGKRGRRKQIEDIVANYLSEKGERGTSGELYDIVHRAGVDIGGAEPSKALASTLSTSDRFNNIRGQGYGLREWGDGPGPKAHKTETPPAGTEGVFKFTGEEATSPNME